MFLKTFFIKEEALAMYTEAVDTCLQAKKNTSDKPMQDKLGKVAIEALERAETLKTKQQSIESSSSVVKSVVRPLGNLLIDKGNGGWIPATNMTLCYCSLPVL